jgi:glycosyltransferase involved in cell wall biosynthesis
MRLLFIIDNLTSAGAQRQIVNLALELDRRGHKIEFFIYHPQFDFFFKTLTDARIPIHQYRKIHRFSVSVLIALRRQIIKGRYCGILSFLDTPSVYAEIANIGVCGTSLVVSERTGPITTRSLITCRLLRHLHRLADHVTVNTHRQRKFMDRKYPWLQGRITTIYNGVDLNTFSPELDEEVCSPDELMGLLAVGTVNPGKNAEGLIRALAVYREKYKKLPFVIRWAGKTNYNPLCTRTFNQADALLSELDLRDHWEWLGVSSDIPSLMRRHQALVHPSFREGLPNAICEAMACGRPVLAGRIVDNPRLVGEGVRGFLFDPLNPESIAKALRDFNVLSLEQRKQMGDAGRMFAQQELSLTSMGDAYERLFEQLTQVRAGPTS